MIDDLRTALRSLRRRPSFTAAVVAILAVALGANTAVFSVLQQTVLHPLPYPGAEDVVVLTRESPVGDFQVVPLMEQLRAWRERSESFTAMEGFDTTRVTLLGRGEPRSLDAAWVTPGLFDFLGVAPAHGRGFEPGADDEGRVILSDGLWRELFGADPEAVGRTLRLGEGVYTVAGVMGRGFRFVPPARAELWLALPEEPGEPQSAVTLARLAPGVSREAAAEELLALERHLAAAREGGDPERVWRPRIHGLGHLIGEDLGRAVWLLQAAVALMLLIACANVGNLFLIRAEGRGREMAVRTAMGAGRLRLIRTLSLESLLLALAGSLLGLAFARWGGSLVVALRPDRRLELETLRLDPGLFAFTAAAGLLAAMAFGLAPALTAARTDVRERLPTGGAGGGTASGGRVRAGMVVAEVALALVLLVGAGLVTRSFLDLLATDPGFEPEGLLAVGLDLPETRYGEPERQEVFVRQLRAALEASGLEGATLATWAPPAGALVFGRGLQVEGRPEIPEGVVDMVGMVSADPGYFRTLGIELLDGRPFTRRDLAAGPGEERPIVINRDLARALWPDGGALGGRMRLGTSPDGPWSRVVGIVGGVAQLGLGSAHDMFQMYSPLQRARHLAVLVRPGGPGRAGASSLRVTGERLAALVHEIDPALPVPEPEWVSERLGGSIARQRFQVALMSAFAAIALALTVVGVYAVLAYSVRRRAFEIGVRAALGARPGQVVGLVAGHGALLVAIGLVLGFGACLALGRVVESRIAGVAAWDPPILAAAVAVLATATTLATLLPALRAARLDPARVLREE